MSSAPREQTWAVLSHPSEQWTNTLAPSTVTAWGEEGQRAGDCGVKKKSSE